MVVKFMVPSSVSSVFLYTAATTLDVYVKKLKPSSDEDLIWLCTEGDVLPDHVVTLGRFIMGLASNMSILAHNSYIDVDEKKCVLIMDIYDCDFNLDKDRIAKLIRDAAKVGSGFVRTR